MCRRTGGRQMSTGINIINEQVKAYANDIQRLIAQGRTVTETLEIARDVAKKLLEA